MAVLIVLLLVVALFFPNTQEALAKQEPALGCKQRLPKESPLDATWSPSLLWSAGVAAAAAIAILQLAGSSEFLYWQF